MKECYPDRFSMQTDN